MNLSPMTLYLFEILTGLFYAYKIGKKEESEDEEEEEDDDLVWILHKVHVF